MCMGVSSIQGCVLNTEVCPQYKGVSSIQGCVLTTSVCPQYRGVSSPQVCVLTTGVCPQYKGVSSLQRCPHYKCVSSLQGCVLTTGVCPHYRGVSLLQVHVLTTGVSSVKAPLFPSVSLHMHMYLPTYLSTSCWWYQDYNCPTLPDIEVNEVTILSDVQIIKIGIASTQRKRSSLSG